MASIVKLMWVVKLPCLGKKRGVVTTLNSAKRYAIMSSSFDESANVPIYYPLGPHGQSPNFCDRLAIQIEGYRSHI